MVVQCLLIAVWLLFGLLAVLIATGNRIQVLIAIDQLINARLGGWADETFSARCWRCRHFKKYERLVWLINLIFFWQVNHCRESYESEIKRRHLPVEYRT